jgi:hypothetical protein
LKHVPRDNLDLIKPFPTLQSGRIPHHAAHPVACREQPRHQPSTHITRGTRYEYKFGIAHLIKFSTKDSAKRMKSKVIFAFDPLNQTSSKIARIVLSRVPAV